MGISFSTNTSWRSNTRSAYYGNPYAYPAHSPYPYPAHRPHLLPPPPPLPPPPVNSYYGSTGYNGCNYANPFLGRALLPPSCPYHCNDWAGVRLPPPPQGVPVPPPPPPYRQSKKVKSGVNVHKDTAKLELDERNPDQHLVSFVFDALCDGSITIFYFAKEEPSCSFVPIYPEVYAPISIPFHKGLGQRFQQPIGTGIDLGFFALEDLSGPLSGKDVFPLVITAATYLPYVSTTEYSSNTQQNLSFHMQANYAVLEKNREGYFNVKVVRQALWVDGVCYELHEIYGIRNHTPDYDNNGSSKDCVICMTEPKDTAVLPCRHMCMCNGCARTLRLQSNKCPICRQHVEELLEIQINNLDD